MTETTVPAQSLPVGHQLADYRITTVLGQGGFGITYKATEETLRREVAIKEYLPQQFAFRDGTGRVLPRSDEDEEMFRWGLTRFLDEGRALAMFRHPNIVSVMRFFEGNGTAYLVMEFEEGMDLGRWLEGRQAPDEKRLVHGILGPLLQGLARVHDKGLLHRDIKPGNIFIRRDGTPVLLDFGSSRPHGTQSSSQLTTIVSAGYSPFEQYGTGAQQGPWSDLYALAGTMYRVIAGRPPVDAIARAQGTPLTPAAEVGRGRYSDRLLKAIDRALSQDIAQRPQDARELLRLLGIEPPPLPDAGDATFVRPPAGDGPLAAARGRKREVAVLTGIAGAAIVVAAVYWRMSGDSAVPAPSPVEQNAPVTAPPPDDAATAPEEPAEDPSEVAEKQPEEQPEEQPAEQAADVPEPPSEDQIIAGLGMPSDVRSWRHEHLAGALLAYTSIKAQLDACQESGCSELPTLVGQLRAAMEPQGWRRGDVRGSFAIEKPRRLDNESCPFMIDVREQVTVGGESREQVRTYCTRNGYDRIVQEAGQVT